MFPWLVARKAVMQRVLLNLIVVSSVPKHFKFSKQGVAEQRLLSDLVQSLTEVKRSNTRVKLATKHVILTVVVSTNSKSSLRQKALLLNVHPRNMHKVVECRKLISLSREFLWTLSIHKQRTNVICRATKEMVLSWWCFETCTILTRNVGTFVIFTIIYLNIQIVWWCLWCFHVHCPN
jgi:hypothetical protein